MNTSESSQHWEPLLKSGEQMLRPVSGPSQAHPWITMFLLYAADHDHHHSLRSDMRFYHQSQL